MELNILIKTQIVPSLSSRSFFILAPRSFWHDLSFCVIWCVKVIQACLVHFLPRPGFNHFFKNPWFLLMRMVFQDHNPGTRDVHSLQVVIVSRLFHWSELRKYTFTHTHTHTLTHRISIWSLGHHFKILIPGNEYWTFERNLCHERPNDQNTGILRK